MLKLANHLIPPTRHCDAGFQPAPLGKKSARKAGGLKTWVLCICLALCSAMWCGLPACPSSAHAQITVQLYDLVYISGGRVLLGDIADLKGDPETIAELRKTQIGPTLKRTESRVVTVEEVKRALPPKLEINFSGSPAVEVRPQLPPGQFCDFGAAIQRRFSLLGGDSIEVVVQIDKPAPASACDTPVQQVERQLAAASGTPIQFAIVSQNILKSGAQIVALDRRDATEEITRHYVSVHLSLYARLGFAAARIARGRTLKQEDLIIRSTDLDRTGLTGWVYHPQQVLGWEAVRTISPHAPLRWDQIRPPAAVRQGDDIQLIIESGLMRVKAPATALQAGAPGEIIWVRIDENGKRVRGRVTEDGLVVLE